MTYDAIVVGTGISGGWAAKELCEKAFSTLYTKEQLALVTTMEKQDVALLEKTDTDKAFFTSVKGLIVTGYMLSEEIGTNHLAYDPIPGNYDGCIPLEQNGGVNWSL